MLAAISAFPPAASSIAIASFLPIPPIAISDEMASSGYRPAAGAGAGAGAEAEEAGAGAGETRVLPEPGNEEVVAAGAEPEADAAPGGGATGGIGLPCLRVAYQTRSASGTGKLECASYNLLVQLGLLSVMFRQFVFCQKPDLTSLDDECVLCEVDAGLVALEHV